HRDVAELLLILVVLGDSIDEGATVEALLAEPAFERREDPRQLLLGIAAAGLDGADEPFAPLLAFALEHRMHEIGFRSEQFVERGLGGTGFVDDRIDSGGVDAVLAEQIRRAAEQAPARGLIIACARSGSGGFPLRR